MGSSSNAALVVCNGGGIGDAVLATPVMRALRIRYARVVALAKPAHASAIADDVVDEVWIDDGGGLGLRARIAAASFDAAVVTWATARTALLLASAGVPERVGQARRLYSPLFTKRVVVASELGDRTTHWTRILMRYAEALGCDGDLQPAAARDAASDARAAALLAELDVSSGGYAVLHPTRGISSTRTTWPLGSLAAIAAEMRERLRIPVLVTGTEGECDSVAAIAHRAGAISVAGRVDLRAFASLAAGARVVVAMDSGPMHIAAATGAPTVGIFAMRPDEPDRWAPVGPRTAVVRPTYPCPRTHTKENCPDFACVRALDPRRVVDAAAGLL